MRTTTYLIVLAMLVGSTQTATAAPILKKGISCLVSAKDDVQIPANQSGVLIEMVAWRGMQVLAPQKNKQGKLVGALMARIDDKNQKAAALVAYSQYLVAHKEAASTVNERFSKKSAEVAEAELEKAYEANRSQRRVVSDTEVRRLQLALERAVLQIEQSQLDQEIAVLTESVRKEEYQAALENIEERLIRAPFAGVVEDIYRQKGEYVREGDPVMRIIRLDELRVQGFINAAEFNPKEVKGRSVKVTIELARGESEIFDGKITFVGSQIQAGGNYQVSADVTNIKRGGVWVLRPGARAKMTILGN